MKLILASRSPRRQELLAMTGFPFEVAPSSCDEDEVLHQWQHTDPVLNECSLVERLAFAKAQASLREYPDCLILAADTIVSLDGRLFGKPKDKDDARKMLCTLSGKTHTVDTGVALLTALSADVFSSVSHVTFHPLTPVTESLIDRYVATGLPLDKAGAYGIQELGGLLISRIEGDFFSVMGLPISEVYQRLTAFDIN
ncbi:MAG TPA: septum formation protein Maf [Clostridiaceae bacterium]|nr:septum formation protein Maf [Clostridiaceae bacterium]